MNILISGNHGFVGRNIVAALKDHYIIYGLDIVSPQTPGVNKTFGWDEIGNIPPVDLIIHLAGLAHDTKSTLNAQKYFEINVGLTKHIFDYFLKSKAKSFVFFSSVKAVSDSVSSDILTEDVLPDPRTTYGKSKLEAERYILSQPVSEGKKIYILRPCMIHGPGNKGNLNLLYKFVKMGIPYPLGAFENKRSFTSIGNLVFIIKQIIERNIPPGIYQVADDEALSTNEVISQISLSLGKKAKVWKLNRQLITKLSKAGDLLHLPLNSARLKKLTENYVVSNSKIKKALGVENLPVSASEGLRYTLDSFIRSSQH